MNRVGVFRTLIRDIDGREELLFNAEDSLKALGLQRYGVNDHLDNKYIKIINWDIMDVDLSNIHDLGFDMDSNRQQKYIVLSGFHYLCTKSQTAQANIIKEWISYLAAEFAHEGIVIAPEIWDPHSPL